MSRSYRKPVVKISSQIDKDIAYKKLRRKVKQELSKPKPDEAIIESDTRDIGVEGWGTRLDYTFIDPDSASEVEIKQQKKAHRK